VKPPWLSNSRTQPLVTLAQLYSKIRGFVGSWRGFHPAWVCRFDQAVTANRTPPPSGATLATATAKAECIAFALIGSAQYVDTATAYTRLTWELLASLLAIGLTLPRCPANKDSSGFLNRSANS
jgi:hypothetical protein